VRELHIGCPPAYGSFHLFITTRRTATTSAETSAVRPTHFALQ
jgi:hypothetical protein